MQQQASSSIHPPLRLLIAGPPGSGKGTQCGLLADHYKNLKHIGTGDMLRAERNKGTLLGQYIDEMWSVKGLEDIALEMIVQSAFSAAAVGHGFVIDGALRTVDSARKVIQALNTRNMKIDCIIEFLFTEEAAIKRLEGRRVDAASGKVYHVDLNPPIEDQGRISRREDDEAEAIRGRYAAYKNNNDVRDFFKEDPASGKPSYLLLDVEGKSIEEVFNAIQEHLLNFVIPSLVKENESNRDNNNHNNNHNNNDNNHNNDKKVDAFEVAKVRQQVKILSGSRQPPTRFPGTHPIGMGRNNVDMLTEREYVFSRKLDGERRMLLLMEDKCFLVDRKMAVTAYPSIRFSSRYNLTLLDGELVVPQQQQEKEKANKEEKEKEEEGTAKKSNGVEHFVVFDALSVGGHSVLRDYLPDRVAATLGVIESIEKETGLDKKPFIFKLQRYFKLNELSEVLQKEADSENKKEKQETKRKDREVENIYGVDGLIFMPVTMPYRLGWCKEITKWKETDTVDFRIFKDTKERREKAKAEEEEEAEGKERWGLHVRGGSADVWYDWIYLSKEDIATHQLAEGDVVECIWERPTTTTTKEKEERSEDKESDSKAREGWKVFRKRTDKATPNADWVVDGIAEILKEPVSPEDLIRCAATAPSSFRREGGGGRGRGRGRGREQERGREGDRGREGGQYYYGSRQGDRGGGYRDRPSRDNGHQQDWHDRKRDRESEGRYSRSSERSYNSNNSWDSRNRDRDDRDGDRYREAGGREREREREREKERERERDNRSRPESGGDSWRRPAPAAASPVKVERTAAPTTNVWLTRQQHATATQDKTAGPSSGQERESKQKHEKEEKAKEERRPDVDVKDNNNNTTESDNNNKEEDDGWNTVPAKKPRKEERQPRRDSASSGGGAGSSRPFGGQRSGSAGSGGERRNNNNSRGRGGGGGRNHDSGRW